MTTCFHLHCKVDIRHTGEVLDGLNLMREKGISEIQYVTDDSGYVRRVFVTHKGSMPSGILRSLKSLGYRLEKPTIH